MIQILPEYIVHHMFKNGWGVGKTERHYLVFEMPIPCWECGFPLITRLDADQIECTTEIDFEEDTRRLKPVEEFGDKR
jgi:hypothetical protein